MSISIDISIDTEEPEGGIDRAQLERTVDYVLQQHGATQGMVSLVVVDDDAIRILKRDWFGLDVVTDVVSFNLGEQQENLEWSADHPFDCELVVNVQQAVRVARQRGKKWQSELNLYVVHGLLHQLGYDDQATEDFERMHVREDEILEELGFGRVFH